MQEINREEKTRGLVAESKIGGHGVESKTTWLLLLLGLFETIGRIWATLYMCNVAQVPSEYQWDSRRDPRIQILDSKRIHSCLDPGF